MEFDGHDQVFVGRVLGIDDMVGFHGDSMDMLVEAFGRAMDDYGAACRAFGRTAQRSHNEALRLRMSPRTRARAAMAAEAQECA